MTPTKSISTMEYHGFCYLRYTTFDGKYLVFYHKNKFKYGGKEATQVPNGIWEWEFLVKVYSYDCLYTPELMEFVVED